MYPGCLPNHIIEERQDIIFRRVRGILNKITPETFDKLSKELVNVGLDSPRTLRGVIYLLFDKALKDLKYSSLYAKLCQILSEKAPNFEQEPGPNTFCKFLISKCEDEFERRRKATEDFDSKNELTDEEYEQKAIAKLKMLGNIKFICELGKKRLLQEEILHECIRGLLSKKKERPIQDQAQDFECLCQIMRTIGSLLDVQASRNLMNQYFERIDMFSQKPELPSRIRFMLKDVIDLRNNNWRPRPFQREDNVPQPLSKLREEAGYDAAIATNSTTIDKLGNNKNLLGISDLSKLHGRGLSSLLIDDDGPSFTTTTDFHWGSTSFMSLDEQPFDVFNSKPPATTLATVKTSGGNNNTSISRNKSDSMVYGSENDVDQSINKRTMPQSSITAPSTQANNSFNSANSFHKSLTSQFNQQNHNEQRHQHLQAPISQQPATTFNSSSNRSQDNNYNRYILTNSSSTKQHLQQQSQRHHNSQFNSDKRNFADGVVNTNTSGPVSQHIVVSNRISSLGGQNQSFNHPPDMKSKYDDSEPISLSQSRTFNNNSINNNNNNPPHNQYQKMNDLSYNNLHRRFGSDTQNRQSQRVSGVVSPVPNPLPHQQYNPPSSRQPTRRLPNEADDARQQPPSHNQSHQTNNRPNFETSKLAEADGDFRESQKFRPRAQENHSNYTNQQHNHGPYQQQEQSHYNQNRHSKFSSGSNYRHAKGPMGDVRNSYRPREPQGYFDKHHERTPESELNQNWRAKPNPTVFGRDVSMRNSCDDTINGNHQPQQNQVRQSMSPVQHSSSASSATSAHHNSLNQTPQNSTHGKHPARFSNNKFVENNSRGGPDRATTYSNPSTINRIPMNQQNEHRTQRNSSDQLVSMDNNGGGFGRRPPQQAPNIHRGLEESYNNPITNRDRDSGAPRFHRDAQPTHQQSSQQHGQPQSAPYSNHSLTRAIPTSKADVMPPFSEPRFSDNRQPQMSREPSDSTSPVPYQAESTRRSQFDLQTKQLAPSSQPHSTIGPQANQHDSKRDPNRLPMIRNTSGEFSDRRDGGSRKFGPNFDRNQEQRPHQQRYRQRHEDDFGPAHREQRINDRNQRINFGPKNQHLEQPSTIPSDPDRVTNWRKDNIPSNPPSSTNITNQNATTPKESSITSNLVPFLNKPRTKVSDANFSLRPSHNLIGRTLSTASKNEADSSEGAKQVTQDLIHAGGVESKTSIANAFPVNNVLANPIQQSAETKREELDATKQSSTDSSNTAKSAARDFHVNKFVAALAEYSSNSAPNANRTASKIKELKIPKSYQSDCLVSAMKQSILKTELEREQVAKLFAQLVPHVFEQPSMILAFRVIFEQLKSLEVETPKVKSLIATFVSRALLDNLMSLEELGNILLGGKHHPLFLLVLQKLQKASGQLWLSEKFTASKINLMDMLPEVDRTKDYLANALKDRCLGFLDPMLTIEPDLWAQMVKEREVSPASVYRWIKDNVDQSILSTRPFAHVLMTCLLKYVHNVAQERSKSTVVQAANADDSAPSSNKSSPLSSSGSSNHDNVSDVEKEMLTKYQQVLQAILKDKQMQLATLYSVQSFLHGLDFPKGSLLRWFHMLYDMNIVDDDVYFTWKEEINDEFPGKGQALFQVNTWLNWLAEDDSEEEEEG